MAEDIIQKHLEEIEDEDIERDQFLVFSVQGQEFGLQAMRIQEISQVMGVTPVPNAPPYIEGILNLRGKLVSVINFRKKFSFPPKEKDEDTRVIMVEHHGFPIGIIVDSVAEVIKIQNERVQGLPESTTTSVSEGYIKGVGMFEKRLIILLDADKLLDKGETAEVGDFAKAIETVQSEKSEEAGETEK